MELQWTVAFLIGLFSVTHCLGMCGGIAGALGMSLSPEARSSLGRVALFNATFGLGRVSSYMLAGALVGAGGAFLSARLGPDVWMAVRLVGTAFLMALGLYIAGLLPQLGRIEHLGRPLWRRLEPLGRRMLPVRSFRQAFGFGLIWGWLPCGLVYYALIYSVSAESALAGALFMGFFGLGTLPALVTAGVMAGELARFTRRPGVRRTAGLLIVVMAPLPLLMHYWHA